SLGFTARFRADRVPSRLETIDSTPVLQRAFDGSRQLTRSAVIDLPALVGADQDRGGISGLARAPGRAIGPTDLTWTDGVGSRFDWRAVDPGLDYQIGFGRTDAFRIVDGDTAATVDRHGSFRARTELRLPLGTRIDVAYAESDATIDE